MTHTPPASDRWQPFLGILSTFWVGVSVLTAAIGGVAALVFTGGEFGFAGFVAFGIGVICALLLGALVRIAVSRRLRADAFSWSDPARDAQLIADFSVRSWPESASGSPPPKYVERDVSKEVREGLGQERFVILKGPRPSGKSRLIYELLKDVPEKVLVSEPLLSAGSSDPLLTLMSRHPGFWHSDGHQTLILRSCTVRLLSGTISGPFLRSWLARHPNISIVATFNDNDLKQIDAAGEDAGQALMDLEAEARVVELFQDLRGKELERARELYPDLSEEQRKFLPRYFSLAPSLRERFSNGVANGHALGWAICCAASDWARAGVSRPAPRRYLEAAAPSYLSGSYGEDFEAELKWCVEPVEGASSLLYRIEKGEVEVGFEADGLIRDLRDQDTSGNLSRGLPGFAWQAICAELFLAVSETDLLGPIEDLLAVQETTVWRDGPDLKEKLLDLVPNLESYPQRALLVDRLVRQASAQVEKGPVGPLIHTRVGDGIYRRLTAVQRLVNAPRPSAAPGIRLSDRLFSHVYVYRTVRALARLGVLIVFDVLSAELGFFGGLALLHWWSGSPHLALEESIGRMVAVCGATTVGLFSICGLYREDAPRAQLEAILLASTALGFVGLTVAVVQGLPLDASIGATIFAVALMTFFSDWSRGRYDRISRRWVRDHGFAAATLLIGTDAQASAARMALADVSRPTRILGHLNLQGPKSSSALGVLDELPEIARKHHAGRVLILDPKMTPAERQSLADFCHAEGLLVEAVPSLADLQPGGTRIILGQSSVFSQLEPLWQRSPGFFAKRAFDLVASMFLIAVLFLPMMVVGIVILADCGWPIVIRTSRPGLGGKTFGMFRFRTSVDPHPSPFELTDTEEDGGGGGATRFGGRLRRHGIDELPQIINVLLGEMSFVGPRPLPLLQHLELDEEDLRRYVVRPGITGPWQVCGRTTLEYDELTRLDVAYLRQWSFFTDLAVLAKSLKLMFFSRRSFPRLLSQG